MARYVLVNETTNIVTNVIRLNVGEAFVPDTGTLLLQVSEATIVGPGMLYIVGSAPPEFGEAPPIDPDVLPAPGPEAWDIVQSRKAELREAEANYAVIAGLSPPVAE